MTNSVNTNYSAQVALQTLNATSAGLQKTQQTISTGLKVADARDDSAVWSIAQNLRSTNSAYDSVTASLNRGKSTLDVANTAGTAISDLLTQAKAAVVAASDVSLDPASRASYQQKYASLAQQITTYTKNASFNGTNLLDGSTPSYTALANADGTSTITAQGQNLNFATGFTGGAAAVPSTQTANAAPASGANVATISQASSFNITSGATTFTVNLAAGGYTAAQLAVSVNTAYSAAGGAGTLATVTTNGLTLTTANNNENISISGSTGDTASAAGVNSLIGGTPVNSPGTAGAKGTLVNSAPTATPAGVTGVGVSQASTITLTTDAGANFTVNLQKSYYSATGLSTAINNAYAAAGFSGTAASIDGAGKLKLSGVSQIIAAGSGDFVNAAGAKTALGLNTLSSFSTYTAATAFTETGGGGVILISGQESFTPTTNYADLLTKLSTSITNVATALGSLGATNNAITNHLSFVSKLQDSLTTGIGNLVDADVAKESANLQALQVKQQLGVQALSIANQGPQIILSLFK